MFSLHSLGQTSLMACYGSLVPSSGHFGNSTYLYPAVTICSGDPVSYGTEETVFENN